MAENIWHDRARSVIQDHLGPPRTGDQQLRWDLRAPAHPDAAFWLELSPSRRGSADEQFSSWPRPAIVWLFSTTSAQARPAFPLYITSEEELATLARELASLISEGYAPILSDETSGGAAETG